MRLLIANGPNLNLLGRREPSVYGNTTLDELEALVTRWAEGLGVEVTTRQTNHEGELIEWIHGWDGDGAVLNPGALTHTSRALADAIAAVAYPVVECHLSNIKQREPWRADSLVSGVCVFSVYGRGVQGYRDAMRHLVNRSVMDFKTVRYGPHPDNVGDLRPGGRGLVVLIHGGIWREEYLRDTTESLAIDLAGRGVSTWNIEYRRIGAGGGWPGSAHDVLTAMDHVAQLDFEGPIVVIGHSAGGHIGMWASARSRSRPVLFVGLACIVDLDDAVADDGVLTPQAALFRESGAPGKVDPGGCPTLLVHGQDDEIVPVRHSELLATRGGHELITGAFGHFDLLDPTRHPWPAIRDRITQLTV